jgi:hypothetical protein
MRKSTWWEKIIKDFKINVLIFECIESKILNFEFFQKTKLKMTKNIYIFEFFEKISKLSYDKCHLFTIFSV